MAPTDETDPVLVPSLPDPWEGLVRNALHSARMAECAELTADFPGIVGAQHAASRAEKALRVALLDLIRGGKTDS